MSILNRLLDINTLLMCRESLPRSSACILLINLPNSHPVQVKTNLSRATSKHCCVMSLQPWLREMFQRLWAEEEGEFCFLWLGDLSQATVLDVSVNLNWLTKECGSLQIHKFDSHTRSATNGPGFLDTQIHRVPSHSGDEGWRFAYKTLQACLHPCDDRAKRSVWVPPIKYSRANVWAGPRVLKPFLKRQRPGSELLRESNALSEKFKALSNISLSYKDALNVLLKAFWHQEHTL